MLASFEAVDGTHCVDVFEREDGRFGFEQYRRESDGASAWQSLGKYSQLTFGSRHEAFDQVKQRVPWLGPSGGLAFLLGGEMFLGISVRRRSRGSAREALGLSELLLI